ncbi:DinB family protein [Curtobacterium sp. PhB115]|uniref:DinB family protein n=1 Tax=Curtobacterium sp. PhB115 TaxID=2485173 RepID=UPI000F4BAE9A|nr:DinB family protein [Curtobacterium sp. PhB115]ROP65301.1 DinB family protein [Curtobacterium sp. PhB115]
MDTAQQDVIELAEYAAGRLTDRMVGLDDDEWAWQPIPGDPDVTIRWRLDHIVETVADDRNREWLGLDPAPTGAPGPAASSASALAALDDAIAAFLGAARALGDAAADPMGAVAGPYGDATRRSFVLHVVDELIHHAAEAAILRDLYAAR